MTVACIVQAHKEPEQLALLLSVLRHPDLRLYVHVDRQAQWTSFEDALSQRPIGDVNWLRRRRSRWGGAELVDVSLDGLEHGLADRCDHFVLISGQDLPIQPIGRIVDFFESRGDVSYLQAWHVSESGHQFHGRERSSFYAFNVLGRREMCIPRGEDTSRLGFKGRLLNSALRVRAAFEPERRYPSYADPYMGSAWWNLSRPAARYVLDFVAEHPDYRRFHEHTWIPDEMFFHSILCGTDFAATNEVRSDDLRFLKFGSGWHPKILRTKHLAEILASGDLFARKFDSAIDADVITEIAHRIRPE